jgi:hypothetical protein
LSVTLTYLHHQQKHNQQGLIARLLQQGGSEAGKAPEKREAEVVHLYETLAQGAGETVRLLTVGDVEAPEAVLTVAQVRGSVGVVGGDGIEGKRGGWFLFYPPHVCI